MHTTNRSLEGLRGAAALLIVLFHMATLAPYISAIKVGYLAVELFFVLSGFVISSAYGDRISTGHKVKRFMMRRVGRLWPLHIVANALYFACAIVPAVLMGHPSFVPYDLVSILALGFMAQGLNLFDYFVGLPVSWSAGDEFYVYLIFATVCLSFRRSRVAAFAVLFTVGYAAAIWVQMQVSPFRSCSPYPFYCMTNSYGWLRCIAGFFAGALAYELRPHLKMLSGPRTQLAICVATIIFLEVSSHFPDVALLAPIIFAATITSLASDVGPVATALQSRAMQYLGRISYSLYLSHAVCRFILLTLAQLWTGVFSFAPSVIFIFASFSLAHLLHRYVEVPWRRRFNDWADNREIGRAWARTEPDVRD